MLEKHIFHTHLLLMFNQCSNFFLDYVNVHKCQYFLLLTWPSKNPNTHHFSSAVVVVCFFVCWAPFHTQRLLYVLQHHRSVAVIRDDICPTQLQKCTWIIHQMASGKYYCVCEWSVLVTCTITLHLLLVRLPVKYQLLVEIDILIQCKVITMRITFCLLCPY